MGSGATFLRHLFFFFFNDTATTEIYTLSLHDALPISPRCLLGRSTASRRHWLHPHPTLPRSEEHTSELQSRQYLVFRLLLVKKKSAAAEWLTVSAPRWAHTACMRYGVALQRARALPRV